MTYIIIYFVIGVISAIVSRKIDKGGHHTLKGDILYILFWPVIIFLNIIL